MIEVWVSCFKFDFWCIWNNFFLWKVVTTRKMVIHQVANEIFSRIISEKASVEKCIKCSRKFCNVFWKTWLAESLLVNVFELQPVFLFKKRLLSEIISKIDSSLEAFFKIAVYLKHLINFREIIRGGVFLAKF